tara:strand:- start:45051 stop:45176 length:126 start_codon:yes stop_codon:yes gene_type:complete
MPDNPVVIILPEFEVSGEKKIFAQANKQPSAFSERGGLFSF